MAGNSPLVDPRDVILPLYEIRSDASWRGIGSSCLVYSAGRRGLILTAKHVLERAADEIEAPVRPPPRLHDIVAVVGSNENGFVARGLEMALSAACDIGLLWLEAPDGSVFGPPLGLDPAPVKSGTRIQVAGYADLSVIEKHDWPKEQFRVAIKRPVVVRDGVVIRRHADGVRDIGWPVVQIDAPIDSGMSGGPVLESRGNALLVRGINCRDLGTASGLGSGAEAFASKIWPTLTVPFRAQAEFVSEDGGKLRIENLLDLFKEEFITDHGEAIRRFGVSRSGGMDVFEWREGALAKEL